MKKQAHTARDPDMSIHYCPRPGPAASARDKEELDRFHMALQTKVDTQDELQSRFRYEVTNRNRERAVARKLFKQAPVAQTMAPTLQPDVLTPPEDPPRDAGGEPQYPTNKLASAEIITRRLEGSLAPRVDAFLEKNSSAFMTEAQRRFPELLKVAATQPLQVPKLKKSPTAVPTQASISGGAA